MVAGDAGGEVVGRSTTSRFDNINPTSPIAYLTATSNGFGSDRPHLHYLDALGLIDTDLSLQQRIK